MILVTGGTGLVGQHLLANLVMDHKKIVATYRSEEKIKKVAALFNYLNISNFDSISWIKVDISDISELQNAFTNITQVYHCAALISFDPYQYRAMRQANIYGTTNIVNCCLKYNIKKLVYLSSIATLDSNTTKPIDENNYFNPDADNSGYAITKNGAEMEVWRASQEGLSTVILNPGIIIGEGDYQAGSGQLFNRIYKGIKYHPSGSTGLISVDQVINTLKTAMNSPISGERFIIVSQNWTFKKLFSAIALGLNKKPPAKEISTTLLNILAKLDLIKGKITKKRNLTRYSIKSMQTRKVYNTDKAQRLLNFPQEDLTQVINRVSKHFLETESL